MILLSPKKGVRDYPDAKSKEIMQKTVEFFENKGLAKIKDDDAAKTWYVDLLEFLKKERVFATLLTPKKYGTHPSDRWDTWRNCEFNEIMAFYGLHYWYTWQVSILGLGPIWMSPNEKLKKQAARQLVDGEVFAFGLSEKEHGADIYSTSMKLTPKGDGTYLANGNKYYIGNGNVARMVSNFSKIEDTGEYCFFSTDSQHEKYELIKNTVNSQSYVAGYALHDYPISEDDILSRGPHAWDSALNTVNVGKFNLGWASIGICTHAMYEALPHAANRNLYGMWVTDFDHVRRFLIDAYCRLTAMKLFALRTSDYMRTASKEDRRYLLYSPIVKMKVTTQGEEVINLLWDVIAAKGFEKDVYFEMAARDIRCLPKLEGTVHVNLALINKFIPNYFFNPGKYSAVPTVADDRCDEFLFDQGPTKGLGKIQVHDYNLAYNLFDLPNVNIFKEQIAVFKESLMAAGPSEAQKKDLVYLLAMGEIFTLICYGQLVLENASLMGVEEAEVDQIFDFMVRDFSKFAVQLHDVPSSSEKQQQYAVKMLRKPNADPERYQKVWKTVHSLKDEYVMNE